MKRVLLTVHKFFPQHRAGTEVLTLKVAQELQHRGYEVLVVTANPPDLDARHKSATESSDYEYEGVPVHVVEESLRLKNFTFKHEFDHPDIAAHFAEIARKFDPTLVHIFHAQNLSAAIIDQCENLSKPVVCSLTDFWFVCPVVQLKRPDGALCRGPNSMATNCLTCYTPQLFPPPEQVTEAVGKKFPAFLRILEATPKGLKNLTAQAMSGTFTAVKLPGAISATLQRPKYLREAANKTAAIMVPTKLMHDIFVENGINSDLLHHVPFGLDTAPLTAHRTKTRSDTVRIGFIGTIFEHKGVDLLVKAFQSLDADAAARLIIYGDMNQFPEYAKTILNLAQRELPNSNKIEFAGTFPNSELGQVLENLDVLVVPSRWYENTPLVIQSALATRTPVIATNLGGMSELVKHDVNGLLFTLNDYHSLADQFRKIVDNPGLLEEFSAKIPEERTVGEMVNDIEKVYEAVLLKSHSARFPLSST